MAAGYEAPEAAWVAAAAIPSSLVQAGYEGVFDANGRVDGVLFAGSYAILMSSGAFCA